MSTTRSLLSSLLLASLVAACGDDGGSATPDAAPPVDACPGGDCGVALEDPEGGNIIFEYIYVDSELQAGLGLPGPTATRAMAYFMSAQTPEANPLPMGGKCNSLDTTKGWPMHVGTPHTDIDVGTLAINGVNTAGTASTIPMTKLLAMRDNLGRPHDLFYQNITPTASDLLKPDTSYDVVMGGTGAFPATTLTDALFLPADNTIGTPAREDNGPLMPTADFTVTWNPATSANLPAGDEVLGLVWLIDSNGSPTHLCPTLHSAGTFTIPAATIADYKAVATARGANPNKVILSRQAVDHRIVRLPNAGPTNLRRIDMLGITCWIQLMDVL